MSNQQPPENPPPISERDAELLSAYIDAMLADDERTELEARLLQDAHLRGELNAMRRTVEWINAMPTLKAPRDFTLPTGSVTILKPAQPQQQQSWWLWAGSAAAALIVIAIGLMTLLPALDTNDNQALSVANAPTAPSNADAAEPQAPAADLGAAADDAADLDTLEVAEEESAAMMMATALPSPEIVGQTNTTTLDEDPAEAQRNMSTRQTFEGEAAGDVDFAVTGADAESEAAAGLAPESALQAAPPAADPLAGLRPVWQTIIAIWQALVTALEAN